MTWDKLLYFFTLGKSLQAGGVARNQDLPKIDAKK